MEINSKFKNLLTAAWRDEERITNICKKELDEQLTFPTSHCGHRCISRDLRLEYRRRVIIAINGAVSLENLFEKLLKDVRI